MGIAPFQRPNRQIFSLFQRPHLLQKLNLKIREKYDNKLGCLEYFSNIFLDF